jgi:bifunctional ADP-heptose synthase (sugar kinase/adenylyltransferase)
MLTESRLRSLLECLPRLCIGVVGDFFLDKYFDLDARLTEQSIETGLDAYQVTAVRCSPGAGGTVTNNLAALGVGRIIALTIIGDDGEGYELRRELAARRVDLSYVVQASDRLTPTYMKPMLGDGTTPPRELNRLDAKNRTPLPGMLVREASHHLDRVFEQVDALIVADQVQAPECGVIGVALRERLGELGQRQPQRTIAVDSRTRIGLYRNVTLKPNAHECLAAVRNELPRAGGVEAVRQAAALLSCRTGRRVFCTMGETGTWVADGPAGELAPAYPVSGPIDIVGAGDSCMAGIVAALAAGAAPREAAALGNLVASITIRQLGTTGTASARQVIEQWQARHACGR